MKITINYLLLATLPCMIATASAQTPASTAPVVAVSETLTNDTIIALSTAGLGDDAIIAKIKSVDGKYDLSTDQMISLRKQGVSGPIIAAMVDKLAPHPVTAGTMMVNDSPDPMVPHGSGLYMLSDTSGSSKMLRMDATISNQAKTGGLFGYALTGGLASMSVKAVIQNESARVKANNHRPIFYFFFDDSNPNTANVSSSWLSGTASVVTSPAEFTLVKLSQKSGRREARVGSVNIGGAKTGVMDGDRLGFDYEMVRTGVYKAVPRQDLLAGEYGFISSIAGGGGGGALTARIYDFSVN